MNVQHRHHRKTKGTRCQSPAQSHANDCTPHAQLHERRKSPGVSLSAGELLAADGGVKLHLIEDSASIQRALSVVINAVAAGTLDPARAKVLLYGLQIASTNARPVAPASKAEKIVRTVETGGDADTLATPTVAGDAELSELQSACADKGEPEERKHENAEVAEGVNQPAETRAETTTSSTTSGDVCIPPPSCFNSAGGIRTTPRRACLPSGS